MVPESKIVSVFPLLQVAEAGVVQAEASQSLIGEAEEEKEESPGHDNVGHHTNVFSGVELFHPLPSLLHPPYDIEEALSAGDRIGGFVADPFVLLTGILPNR